MEKLRLRGENGKIYYGWYICILSALIGNFIYNGIISTTGVFLLPVTMELGIPVGQFSLYISILSVVNIITLLCINKVLSPKNMKPIMIVAGLLGIVSFIGFSKAATLTAFYIWSIPMGFCFSACTMTPCTIMINNWFGPLVRGKAMSIYMGIMSLLGLGTINVLNGIIMSHGWRGGYIFCAAGVAICIPLIALIAKWSPAEKGLRRMGDPEDEAMAAMMAVNPENIPGITFAEAKKKPITWVAFISCILMVLASSAMLQHGIPTFVMAGVAPEFATFLSSLISIALIGSTVVIGAVIDKCGPQVGVILTSGCFALAVLAYGMVSPTATWLMYPGIILYVFGVPAINLMSPIIFASMYGDKDISRFIAIMNMFIAIGGIFGAPLVGSMMTATGGYRTPWLVMTVVLAIALVLRIFCTSKKYRFVPEAPKTEGAE